MKAKYQRGADHRTLSCARGHERTPENTRIGIVMRNGEPYEIRHCRLCAKERSKECSKNG